MKKTFRWILISLAILLTLGTVCAVASGVIAHDAITPMEKKHLHDILAIRGRLDDVEDQGASITVTVKDYDDDSDQDNRCTCTSEHGHMTAPETEGVADETIPSYESPEPLYTVRAHEGIIGIFDADGTLCRSVNVFVMTLPEADREALAAGIPAYSEEEMRLIAERFA
jgi:hypothetical protein